LARQAAGWDPASAEWIRLAAPMHDIGKAGIPDAILQKPSRLAPEEVLVVQTHPSLGARMLAGSASPVLRMAAEIALGHHERWDGRGRVAGA
jgi:putative two-component system response regulator